MARPRKSSKKVPHRQADLSNLSTEVLRLRLQAQNLPITGSRSQLVRTLRAATSGSASPLNTRSCRISGRVQKRPNQTSGRTRTRRPRTSSHEDLSAEPASPSAVADEDESASDAGSSLDDLLDNQFADEPMSIFSPAQLAAIQETVTHSVQSAMASLQSPGGQLNASTHQPGTPQRTSTASPLGLTRPLDRNLEDRILRGEYIDFACLLPDSLYQPQSPDLQLRLDSSPSSSGSPLTMVRKKKAVIDSFHKWLDAYTTYMLVLVAAFPRHSLELIKYQQIISKAVGLAWQIQGLGMAGLRRTISPQSRVGPQSGVGHGRSRTLDSHLFWPG